MDLQAIRDAMKTRLEAIDNLFCYDTMPSSPTLPAAIVAPASGAFISDVTLDGAEDLNLTVTVLVQKVVDSVAQDTLDDYLSEGAADITAAIDSGSTANWDFAMCGSPRGYGQYTFGDGDAAQRYLGFEIPVLVGVS